MIRLVISIFALVIITTSCDTRRNNATKPVDTVEVEKVFEPYVAPDTTTLKDDEWGKQVKYGLKLVQNTSYYLGPNGVVSKNLGNKMNCTNCHLNNGTKPFGLNYFDSHKTYPQYRAREDKILTMADRVNNCIERPHSGTPIALDSKEMIAIVSYIKWVGDGYDREKHEGYGLKSINYDSLRADSQRGAIVYATHCKTCHQENGEGLMNLEKTTYVNPPLWGEKSYQEGSSMHRVLKAAAFIKYNMPNKKTTWESPTLTDQEALDVAAFINDGRIHKRPKSTAKYVSYANLKTKPIDYFKGPYLDDFSEDTHTFGPWYEIETFYKMKNVK